MQLTVTDIDGRDSAEPLAIPITLLADERPFVRMVQPGRPCIVAVEDHRLSLRADDEVEILVALQGV